MSVLAYHFFPSPPGFSPITLATLLPVFLAPKWIQYLYTLFPALSFSLSPSSSGISPLNSILLDAIHAKLAWFSCKLKEVLFIPKGLQSKQVDCKLLNIRNINFPFSWFISILLLIDWKRWPLTLANLTPEIKWSTEVWVWRPAQISFAESPSADSKFWMSVCGCVSVCGKRGGWSKRSRSKKRSWVYRDGKHISVLPFPNSAFKTEVTKWVLHSFPVRQIQPKIAIQHSLLFIYYQLEFMRKPIYTHDLDNLCSIPKVYKIISWCFLLWLKTPCRLLIQNWNDLYSGTLGNLTHLMKN